MDIYILFLTCFLGGVLLFHGLMGELACRLSTFVLTKVAKPLSLAKLGLYRLHSLLKVRSDTICQFFCSPASDSCERL